MRKGGCASPGRSTLLGLNHRSPAQPRYLSQHAIYDLYYNTLITVCRSRDPVVSQILDEESTNFLKTNQKRGTRTETTPLLRAGVPFVVSLFVRDCLLLSENRSSRFIFSPLYIAMLSTHTRLLRRLRVAQLLTCFSMQCRA